MAERSSSIAKSSTAASFYENAKRRGTLLVHPVGMGLLEYYGDQKNKSMPTEDEDTTKEIAKDMMDALNTVPHVRKTDLSDKLRMSVSKNWRKNQKKGADFTVTGENEEMVCGKIQQAFKYARLIRQSNTHMILLWLHYDRTPKDKSLRLQIVQEAFLFDKVGDQSQKNNDVKMGLLWREIYDCKLGEDITEAVMDSCKGIVRYLNCAEHLSRQQPTDEVWEQRKNYNIAFQDKTTVYKIFDNRFYPTYRKVDYWLAPSEAKEYPWTKGLNVREQYALEENIGSKRFIGKPWETVDEETSSSKRRKVDSVVPTPYGKGAVVILSYDYQDGTHVASKLSHFLDIAKIIQSMQDRVLSTVTFVVSICCIHTKQNEE